MARMTISLTAVAVWFVFGLIAFGVGAVREVFLRPRVGEPTAHAIGTLSAVALVALVIHAYIRRVHESCSRADLLRIGLLWLVLTVAFEFGFFHYHYVVGKPWDVLLADYNILRGRLWVLVLATVLLGPILVGTIPGRGRGAGPVLGLGIPLDERTALIGAAAAGSRTTAPPRRRTPGRRPEDRSGRADIGRGGR